MKSKIKALFTFLFLNLMKTHKDEISKAKAIAEKAKKNIELANKQFEASESKYNESINNIRQEMIKLNEVFNNSIVELNSLQQVKEKAIKIVEPKE